MELTVNNNIKNTAILLVVALILITIIRLNYPLMINYSSSLSSYKNSAGNIGPINFYGATEDVSLTDEQEKCDVSTGEWVPDPGAPYYTNKTCWAIHEHQNCMKYGRPDTGFLKWRWKPDGCDLPVFNPFQFLEMVRGKRMAFVGDSVGRNQMQSLICLLSRVEYPTDDSPSSDEDFKRWIYQTHNFTLAYFRSPFLIRSSQRSPDGPTHTGLFDLHLDEPDPSWAPHIDGYDFLILSSGHWFTRTAVYYHNRTISGCHFCQLSNVSDLKITHAFRRAFRTAFKAIDARKGFDGVVFLRTFAPSHFEGGAWDKGGDCRRRGPYRSDEKVLEGSNLDLYMVQLEEFRAAERLGRKRVRLLDTTQAMLLRPDGHPSRYGHWPNENVTLYNDCVHWCLPGPIDSWADFLAHGIKMEVRRREKEGERVFFQSRKKKMQ